MRQTTSSKTQFTSTTSLNMNIEPMFPSFFILGVAKCGTTSLHEWLSQHSQIAMAEPKESFFFEAEFERGIDFYRKKYFKHWQGEPLTGESRHRNFYLSYVPERIRSVAPQTKFILIFRDPVERAYSHWWHWYRNGRDPLSFEDALKADLQRIQERKGISTPAEIARYSANIDKKGMGPYRTYLDSGYYAGQLKHYYRFFPRERFKIFIFEEMSSDPLKTVKEACEFLGVDPSEVERFDFSLKNRAKKIKLRRMVKRIIKNLLTNIRPNFDQRSRPGILVMHEKGKMTDETRKWLQEHYRSHNDRLRELIDYPLTTWR